MEPLKIATSYVHPGNHLPQELLLKYKSIKFNNKNIRGLYAGDFNSPHLAFGSRFTNLYGTSLLNGINQNKLIFLNNGEPTFFSTKNGQSNLLDLVLCDEMTFSKIESCLVGSDLGTDHLPVITSLSLPSTKKYVKAKPVKSFDSNHFTNLINSEFTGLDTTCNSTTDIDCKIKEMEEILKTAMNESTSVKFNRSKRILPQQITNKIEIRKALLKNMKKCTDSNEKMKWSKLYNRCNNEVKSLLRAHDQCVLEEKVNDMTKETDVGKMWKKLNRLKDSFAEIPNKNPPLRKPDGSFTESNDEKCEVMASRLENVHCTPRNPIFDEQWRESVDEFVETNSSLFSLTSNDLYEPCQQYVTPTILRDKILLARKGSPGEDGITYDHLRRCSTLTLSKICTILNHCQHFGYFPLAWRHAKVVMIPKPGKDASEAAGYRPISLLSCIGKCFERIICDQLIKILDEKGFFCKQQAGFRKGHSTHEHLFKLSQDIMNGFKRKECTLSVFLDVASAFDAVWTNGLKLKLQQIGLPKRLLSILCSFLDSRSLQVWIVSQGETWKSRAVSLKAGTPQGSCLSPILYIIFVNDIPVLQNEGVVTSQYADDIGVWATTHDPITANNLIQKSLHLIESWCEKWQITLSPAKTKALLFSRFPTDKQAQISLHLFNESLSLHNEAMFLGAMFDVRMTWEPEIKRLVEKASKRINLLRSISTLCSKPSPDFLIKIYKALVLPVFEYGCIASINAAEVHMKKLQVLQNCAIRACLRLPAYIAESTLHDASGLTPIFHHLRQSAQKRLSAISQSSPMVRDSIEKYKKVKWNKKHPSPLDILQSEHPAEATTLIY